MAAIQQHFISLMFAPANEIVAAVQDLGNRLDVVKQLQKSSEVLEEEEKEEAEAKENKGEKDDTELASILKGLDKSALVDNLKKIPELKPAVIDFFTKQIGTNINMIHIFLYYRFTKKTEETKESTENKDTNGKKD
ncbi:hypothetical protein RFI_24137 [Reticulomyxa filosa]|uniref:Uncharacterized protein n=1 Tax=Reticulomyxa filosa TaxID=46433 RepID=X6MIG5_RETFI|nr:hypothetical protein RFI_24137 [Reticulomyxa filosa]|eukprot:ETO13237.1 hypothetical protein RFI_24137 [Reticulomyxa filosa]